MLKRAATVLPSSATVAENRNASSESRKSAARTAAWIGNASHAMTTSATRPAHCRSFILSIFRYESDRESRQIDGHQDDSVTRLGRGAECHRRPGLRFTSSFHPWTWRPSTSRRWTSHPSSSLPSTDASSWPLWAWHPWTFHRAPSRPWTSHPSTLRPSTSCPWTLRHASSHRSSSHLGTSDPSSLCPVRTRPSRHTPDRQKPGQQQVCSFESPKMDYGFAWQECRVCGEGDISAPAEACSVMFPIMNADIGTPQRPGARAPFAYPGQSQQLPTASYSRSSASSLPA